MSEILVSDGFIPAVLRLVEILRFILQGGNSSSELVNDFFNRCFDGGKIDLGLFVAIRAIDGGTVLEPAEGFLKFVAAIGACEFNGDFVNIETAGDAASVADMANHGGSFHE